MREAREWLEELLLGRAVFDRLANLELGDAIDKLAPELDALLERMATKTLRIFVADGRTGRDALEDAKREAFGGDI